MNMFYIAINYIFLNFLYFSKNVSGLKRNSTNVKPYGESLLQFKSSLAPENVQQSLAPTPVVPGVPNVANDPEGLKKAVAASVLSSQAVPQNGPLAPADLTNLPQVQPVPPVPVQGVNQVPFVDNLVNNMPGSGDASTQTHLNVILDPSLENISSVEKQVKFNTEHAVHYLKTALEKFTNLSSLLDQNDNKLSFSVDGEDYTVLSTLEMLNKVLKQVEGVQKVLFAADSFVLKQLTKAATGTFTSEKNSK